MSTGDAATDGPRPARPRRLRRWLLWSAAAVVLLAVCATGLAYALVAASRPMIDGTIVVSGLTAPIEIERDQHGVPVLRGQQFEDVIFAQGFVHGQDRFFQMDTFRRHAAGELSAIIGPPAFEQDRKMRRYRFAAVADQVVEQLPPDHRRLLERYAAGVNAAMNELRVDPPEYLLLQAAPQPWTPRDSVLVQFAMFDLLHPNVPMKRATHTMRQTMPAELVEFLTTDVSRFDAPLVSGDGEDDGIEPPAIPGPEIVDLRNDERWRNAAAPSPADFAEPLVAGSNNWAVAGQHAGGDAAMLANDPHLPLNVPNTWYRVQMHWGMGKKLVGASIPGSPAVIAGSNGHVAWGVTNAQADFQDLIIIETDPDDPDRYLTADGSEPFGTIEETVSVNGRPDKDVTIRTTRWGPVIDHDHRDRPIALQWTALHPEMVSLDIIDLPQAGDVPEAVNVLRRWWGPAQNVALADADGRVGWIVTGFLPNRRGEDGKYPRLSTDPDAGWAGPLDESRRPIVINPDDGLIHTANQRTLPVDRARSLGRHWAEPFRARRIASLLADGDPPWTERDMLDLQLDTRSEPHDFYRDLIVELADARENEPVLDAAAEISRRWSGRATQDDPAMRLLVDFRRELHGRLIDALTVPAKDADPDFVFRWFMTEEPVRRILESRSDHMLPLPFETWDDFLTDVLATTIDGLDRAHGTVEPLWSETNRLAMSHPVSEALPAWLTRFVDMPQHPQPGARQSVRVASPTFASSFRMIVRPGREEDGVFHMPGGQSGHLLSPFYDAGHDAWRDGVATPLLAGPPKHHLTLSPPG